MSNHEGYPDPTADKAIRNVCKEQTSKKQKSDKEKERMKLKRVTRIDSIPVGSTYFNEQGFLHDTPIVTSTGIFEYALPDGGTRRELRLPEHVFDSESLASYSGKPVIITHNAGSIDKNNVMDEIVGTMLSEGFQDGNDVRCKIVIHDIDKVKAMPYRELSLGYSLDLIEEPGEWNGAHYDAIQTNIRINHLAIVQSARAGEQAHLNLDGKKVELDDKETTEGGKEEMNGTSNIHVDGVDMTPEELIEAIKAYREAHPVAPAEEPVVEAPVKDEDVEVEEEVTEPVEPPVAPIEEPQPEPVEPEEEQADGMGAILEAARNLVSAIEAYSAPQKTEEPVKEDGDNPPVVVEEECNGDGSEDMSQSMNLDSADDVFRQRLSICRVGDKLHMDGLEEMSIVEGKKAIIAKVLPNIRLDGKDRAYIDALYDLAVSETAKRKDVNYQRQQMTAVQVERTDGNDNVSMADSARKRMLEREGGKE